MEGVGVRGGRGGAIRREATGERPAYARGRGAAGPRRQGATLAADSCGAR